MPRTPRLKVYAAAAGFSEAVVAASSQKAALEAWGARDDYFAHGIARVVDDPETVKAALAQPGVVLKRPIGTAKDFIAAAKSLSPRKTPSSSSAAKPARKPDRAPLDAAEEALKAAERRARDLDREQREERGTLETRQAEARKAIDAEVTERTRTREAAYAAYRKAGG